MIRLLSALYREPRLERENAMRISFGLRQISPEHGPIWDDLLFRLRRFLPPELKIISRSGWISCEGSWAGVEIIGGEDLRIEERDEKHSALGRREKRLLALEARTLTLFSTSPSLERTEIENELGISRAATNRLITRMILSGRIVRSGKTKASSYQLVGASLSTESMEPKSFTCSVP
jgi:hypothetical protein